MKRTLLLCMLLALTLSACSSILCVESETLKIDFLHWTRLPDLTPATWQSEQIGLAGPFAGVHNDALIVANGANFPLGHPWEIQSDRPAPPKVYHDGVFALVKVKSGGESEVLPNGDPEPGSDRYKWMGMGKLSEHPFSYGASLSTPDGIICIGGERSITEDGQTTRTLSDGICVLRWNAEKRVVEKDDRLLSPGETAGTVAPFPSLPKPCTMMAVTMLDNVIYVAGGDCGEGATTHFWALDLKQKTNPKEFQWRELVAWPGPARILPIMATQNNGERDCVYLFSGRNIGPDRKTEFLSDAYAYNPKKESWIRLTDIAPIGADPRCVMAGTGVAAGTNYILIFGGANGEMFQKIAELDKEIARLRTEAETAGTGKRSIERKANSLERDKASLLKNHPGFSHDVLAYRTNTNAWSKVGVLPRSSQVTTVAVPWNGAFIIPTGEISPGIRTPEVWKAKVNGL